MESFGSSLDAAAAFVREQAAECERRREFTPDILALLRGQGLFRAWIAHDFQGYELDLPASLRLFERAAWLDGSFGWAVTIGAGGGLFSATMDPRFARQVFAPADAVIAGSGSARGTAREAPGGFRVSGRWPYASGAQYATWFTASTVLCEPNGTPRRDAQRRPIFRAMTLERSQVRVLDTWNALGMRATTSHDFEVDDVFVPHGRTFDVLGDSLVPGPLYRFPFLGIAETSFAAVALGVATHGIEAFRALAAEKRLHYSGQPLHENAVARYRIAEAETALSAVRQPFYDAVDVCWDGVSAGGTLDEATDARLTVASVAVAEAATRALDALYPLAGMPALFRDSEFGRCWRDLHTVAQHGLLTPTRASATFGAVTA